MFKIQNRSVFLGLGLIPLRKKTRVDLTALHQVAQVAPDGFSVHVELARQSGNVGPLFGAPKLAEDLMLPGQPLDKPALGFVPLDFLGALQRFEQRSETALERHP